MHIEITSENFETEVIKSDKPAIVDFWAEWCGPCRMMAPVLDEISEEREDVKVCKLNVDDEPELANRYEVSAIPTILCFRDGEVAAASIGFKQKEELLTSLGL